MTKHALLSFAIIRAGYVRIEMLCDAALRRSRNPIRRFYCSLQS
jgi:hypothetical protein